MIPRTMNSRDLEPRRYLKMSATLKKFSFDRKSELSFLKNKRNRWTGLSERTTICRCEPYIPCTPARNRAILIKSSNQKHGEIASIDREKHIKSTDSANLLQQTVENADERDDQLLRANDRTDESDARKSVTADQGNWSAAHKNENEHRTKDEQGTLFTTVWNRTDKRRRWRGWPKRKAGGERRQRAPTAPYQNCIRLYRGRVRRANA